MKTNFNKWVPFAIATIIADMSPESLKVYIRKDKVQRINHPVAPGRFLYYRPDLIKLSQRIRRPKVHGSINVEPTREPNQNPETNSGGSTSSGGVDQGNSSGSGPV